MPGVDKVQMTHWHECWREHHECAVARIEELEETLGLLCGWLERDEARRSLAYATLKELLAENEEDKQLWNVTRQNILAAREAVRQALGQH